MILIILLGFFLAACQKEIPVNDNELTFNDGRQGAFPGEMIHDAISTYLVSLAGKIDTLVMERQINMGNANSLVAKIGNAVKSYSKSNMNAFSGQLNAFVDETKSLVEEGSLYSEVGGLLIGKIETVKIAIEGSFADPLDGYIYPVVLLGDQLWMAENLRAIKYSDGTEIPQVGLPADWANTTTGAYCWFGNRFDMFGSKYGAMYNWQAVSTGKLCPAGWHVPSLGEWIALKNYLILNDYGYNGNPDNIAKAMAATSGWTASAIAATPGNDMASNNSSGFNALPGGQRGNNGTFSLPMFVGNWWSKTAMIPDKASYGSNIIFNSPVLRTAGYAVRMGMYVRCVR